MPETRQRQRCFHCIMDVIVVVAGECVAHMWRRAHRERHVCRQRCWKRGRNGTRRTSRADVWPTKRGTSRPTCERKHAQQEWDAAHIARGRLGNQKREGPSYLSNSNAKSTLFRGNMDDINVYAANCVSGMWRAHIASGCCRPRCRMRGRSGTRRPSRAERFVVEGAK